jgi:hypothetical protein
MLLVDLLPTDNKQITEIKKELSKDISSVMAAYEAELFQDRYLPEYQKQAREISRREKAEAELKRQRELEAMNRVAALSGDVE